MDNPFDAATTSYSRVRPGYPAEALNLLLAAPSGAVRVSADVGAGTGKMTLQLLERGLDVRVVEPAEAMRAQLARACDEAGHRVDGERLDVLATTGEETGLESESVDLVVYAQSWHWLDPERAGDEAARILRPGGAVGAVWNQMDVTVPWVHRLTRIMRSGDVHRVDDPPRFGEHFEEPTLVAVAWEDRVTPEALMELGTTRSSYLRSDLANREHMQANLRWYLFEELGFTPGREVTVPYSTLVWTARISGEVGGCSPKYY